MKKKNLKTLSLKKDLITSFEKINGGQPPSIYASGCNSCTQCISCVKSCANNTYHLGCVKSFDNPCNS